MLGTLPVELFNIIAIEANNPALFVVSKEILKRMLTLYPPLPACVPEVNLGTPYGTLKVSQLMPRTNFMVINANMAGKTYLIRINGDTISADMSKMGRYLIQLIIRRIISFPIKLCGR